MSADRTGGAGFTLVEVLVALAVLALVGTAVVEAERLAVSGSARAEARARGLAAAASLLAEREAGARRDGSGRLADGATFRIASRTRVDLVRPGAPIRPVEMSVEVTPSRGGRVRLSGIGWIAAQ